MRIEMQKLEGCYIDIIAEAEDCFNSKFKKTTTLLKNVSIVNGWLLSDHCRLKSKHLFYWKVKLRAKVQTYYKKWRWGMYMDLCLWDVLFVCYL